MKVRGKLTRELLNIVCLFSQLGFYSHQDIWMLKESRTESLAVLSPASYLVQPAISLVEPKPE